MRAVEYGTILLDHNQVEKITKLYNIAWNGCLDLWYFLPIVVDLAHVILDTRPSRLSYATLKSWEGLGTRL